MSITLATGTQFAIASTYGTAVAISALTNAAEAVATLAAGHGVQVGDFVEITSGWDLLTNRIARVKAVATNDITLESIDTTSTTRFPAGTGLGTLRRITAWIALSQITDGLSVSGGDQQFANVTTIADRTQKQIPTTRNPIAFTLPVFDDPTLPWYATVRAASESATPAAVRMIFPNQSKLVANAYWSLQQVPTIEDSTLRSSMSLTFLGDPTRYAN